MHLMKIFSINDVFFSFRPYFHLSNPEYVSHWSEDLQSCTMSPSTFLVIFANIMYVCICVCMRAACMYVVVFCISYSYCPPLLPTAWLYLTQDKRILCGDVILVHTFYTGRPLCSLTTDLLTYQSLKINTAVATSTLKSSCWSNGDRPAVVVVTVAVADQTTVVRQRNKVRWPTRWWETWRVGLLERKALRYCRINVVFYTQTGAHLSQQPIPELPLETIVQDEWGVTCQ